MKTFDQYGRLLVWTEGEVSDPGASSGGTGYFPHLTNPDTGVRKWALTVQVDGEPVMFFTDPYPKAQDSDDNLWRYVYIDEVDGQTVMWFSEEADEIPGYELIVKDITDGATRKLRTRQQDGQTVGWYEEV